MHPSRDEKLSKLENESFAQAIRNSRIEFETSQKAISFTNFEEFLDVFNLFQLPEGWLKIIDIQKVIFYKLKFSPASVITYSIIITSNLRVETFLYGCEKQIALNEIETALKIPFTSNNINEIKDLLNSVDKNTEERSPEKNDKNEGILKNIFHLSLTRNMSDGGGETFQNNSVQRSAFLSKQLK